MARGPRHEASGRNMLRQVIVALRGALFRVLHNLMNFITPLESGFQGGWYTPENLGLLRGPYVDRLGFLWKVVRLCTRHEVWIPLEDLMTLQIPMQ